MNKGKARDPLSQKILDLTLEMIFLLTGEHQAHDALNPALMVVKIHETVSNSSRHHISEGHDRSQSFDMEPPLPSGIHEQIHEKILELSNQIIRLLTGEVPIRCEDVTVYLSMEEWEYVERHKDLYEDVMMEDHQPVITRVLASDRSKSSASGTSAPSSHVTESKPGLQENQRNFRSSLCKPREGLSRSESGETDRQTSYEEGNSVPSQARYWFPPGKESTSCKDLTDAYPSTMHAQEEYKFTPNQEALASGEGDSIIEVQISAATGQSETAYLSAAMKEEPALCNGGDLSVADVYSLPEQTRTGYPSRPVSKDLALREEGNPTGVYSPGPLVEQSRVLGQKPKTNADLYVQMFHETDGTSTPPQNTHGPERTSVFSGYNALFSIPSDSLASPGVAKLQPFPAKQQVTCKACGRRFDEEGLLKLHWLTHVGERTYTCSECGEHFPLHAELIKHMKTHRGPKMYPCSDCGKAFNRESHLNLHLRTHTGEKPYTCPECGKSFSQKSHLRRHLSVHTGVKQYGCIECGITFMRKSDLVQHQISHAEGEAFICSDCGKCYYNHSDLLQHQRTHSKGKDLLF